MAAQYEGGCYETYIFTHVVREGLLTDDVGVAKGTVFHREVRSWSGFKTGDFVEEKSWGGVP